jgi:hypothetical protein
VAVAYAMGFGFVARGMSYIDGDGIIPGGWFLGGFFLLFFGLYCFERRLVLVCFAFGYLNGTVQRAIALEHSTHKPVGK